MAMLNREVLSQWARRRLAVAPEASADEVRAAFLRVLARDQFIPEPATAYAFRVLQGSSGATDADLGKQQALVEIEADLRKEVDAFARDPEPTGSAKSRERGKILQEKCHFLPSLSERMERCGPKAPCLPADSDEGREAFLAMLRELNGMSRVQAAQRRQTLLRELETDMDRWQRVAADVARHHPDAAQLDPVFCDYFKQRRLSPRVDDQQWQGTFPDRIYPAANSSWQSDTAAQTPQSQGSSTPSWPWGAFFFAFIIIGALLRGCASTSNRFDREPPFNPPGIPKFNPEHRINWGPAKNKAEVDELLNAIKRRAEERRQP